ncbi:MAG: ribbon-helix-helix protein, CopG family [Dethiobacter sp.]|nr:ribbon-helix-helix protein, CopG family [Dethiobacter sp.]
MAEQEKLKKVTFALPESVLHRLRELVAEKRVSSANAVVREAVEEYIIRIEREEFARSMAEAAKDPEFIRDIREADDSFRDSDAETAKMTPPW